MGVHDPAAPRRLDTAYTWLGSSAPLMNQLSRFGFLLCAWTMVGCSSADAGDSDPSTTTPQTTSATDPTTGSSGVTTTDPTTETPGTSTDPTTGPGPTTDATTGPGPTTTTDPTTGEPMTSTESATTGDDTTGAAAVTASAVLGPKSGSQVTGTVLFTDLGGGMADLVIEVSNVTPPGTHALHIHQIPDCSADDGTSTGDHWNPNGTMLGELGTVEIGNDGTGVFMKTDAWSIGTGQFDDVDAHSIIIHAEANGGTRIACGVIAKD